MERGVSTEIFETQTDPHKQKDWHRYCKAIQLEKERRAAIDNQLIKQAERVVRCKKKKKCK